MSLIRLTAGGARFEDQDVEAFGGAIHSRRQPSRPATDNHEIADARLIDGLVEAEGLGNLRVAGVPQHRASAADQDRHISRAHMKLVEQGLRVGVAIQST